MSSFHRHTDLVFDALCLLNQSEKCKDHERPVTPRQQITHISLQSSQRDSKDHKHCPPLLEYLKETCLNNALTLLYAFSTFQA